MADINDLKKYLGIIAEMQPGGMYDLLLKNGREFKITADTFKGRRMKRGNCYANAGQCATRDDDLTYVEGYVMLDMGVPIQHGWLADKDGNVIDPTLRKGGGVAYWGIPFSRDYLNETILRERVWGVFHWKNHHILKDDPKDFLNLNLKGLSDGPQPEQH